MLSLSQRPLTASHADFQLFVDRENEIDQALQSLRLGLNVYVTGPPGIGRTSFLRQIQRQQADSCFVRLNQVSSIDEALHELCRILDERDGRYGHPALRQPTHEVDLTDQVGESPFDRLRTIGDQLPSWVHLIVIVDDLTADVRYQLFGRSRDELWELPIQWVVAGTDPFLDPPADAFFESIVELGLFDTDVVDALLLRRAESGTADDQSVLRELAMPIAKAVAPCTPRRALSVAGDVLKSDDPGGVSEWLHSMSLNQKWLSESGRRVLSALTIYGPTHAGDERLLAEVGVSRNRVVQILGELEAEGLVAAKRVGRRKVFLSFSKPVIPQVELVSESMKADAVEEDPW